MVIVLIASSLLSKIQYLLDEEQSMVPPLIVLMPLYKTLYTYQTVVVKLETILIVPL